MKKLSFNYGFFDENDTILCHLSCCIDIIEVLSFERCYISNENIENVIEIIKKKKQATPVSYVFKFYWLIFIKAKCTPQILINISHLPINSNNLLTSFRTKTIFINFLFVYLTKSKITCHNFKLRVGCYTDTDIVQ